MFPARWRVLAACFLCYAFDAMDFMVLALSLPKISSEWQLGFAQAGLLGTAGMIGVGLSSVVVGWYADNSGRRPALALCVTVFALFTAAGSQADSWSTLLLLRFLAGIGLGGTWGVIAAYMHETWPDAQRGRAVSFVLSSWPVGYIVAALVARAVLPTEGWRGLFLLGGTALLGALFVWLFVPESEEWRRQRGGQRNDRVAVREIFAPGLARLTVLGTLAAAMALTAYWGTNTWLPTYLTTERGLATTQMADFLIVLNLGMFAGYQLWGWLIDHIGRRRSVLLCLAGGTLLLPVYARLQDLQLLYWLGPVLGIFLAYTGPFGAYFPRLYPTRMRSLGAGFCFDVGRGVAAFAPYAFGQLATSIGLSAAIAWSAVGFAAATILMWFMPEA
jgi:MFS family permease